jgi:hypothetical protein
MLRVNLSSGLEAFDLHGCMIHQSIAEVIASPPRIADANRIRSRSSALCSIAAHRTDCPGKLAVLMALCPVPLIRIPGLGNVLGRRVAGNHVFGLSTVNHPAVATLNPLRLTARSNFMASSSSLWTTPLTFDLTRS